MVLLRLTAFAYLTPIPTTLLHLQQSNAFLLFGPSLAMTIANVELQLFGL